MSHIYNKNTYDDYVSNDYGPAMFRNRKKKTKKMKRRKRRTKAYVRMINIYVCDVYKLTKEFDILEAIDRRRT